MMNVEYCLYCIEKGKYDDTQHYRVLIFCFATGQCGSDMKHTRRKLAFFASHQIISYKPPEHVDYLLTKSNTINIKKSVNTNTRGHGYIHTYSPNHCMAFSTLVVYI